MKNSHIKLIAFATISVLFLSACGGGGGNSNAGTTTPPPAVVKVPQCGSAAAVDVAGKTIRKDVDGAEVRISHKPDGSKTACMISGTATIL